MSAVLSKDAAGRSALLLSRAALSAPLRTAGITEDGGLSSGVHHESKDPTITGSASLDYGRFLHMREWSFRGVLWCCHTASSTPPSGRNDLAPQAVPGDRLTGLRTFQPTHLPALSAYAEVLFMDCPNLALHPRRSFAGRRRRGGVAERMHHEVGLLVLSAPVGFDGGHSQSWQRYRW
jgi:hypothetical protein